MKKLWEVIKGVLIVILFIVWLIVMMMAWDQCLEDHSLFFCHAALSSGSD